MQKSNLTLNTFVAGLIGYLLSLKPIFDPDVDWHLAAGRWMVENKSWIHTDPFSWTFQGKPWVSITWLHEVISWLLYSAGGDTLLVMGLSLIPALTLSTLYRSIHQKDDKLETQLTKLIAISTVGLISCTRWSCRPEIWTHFIGTLFVFIILRALVDPKKTNLIYLLIPLQLFWTNLHGIFILGPLLIGMGYLCQLTENQKPLKNKILNPWFYTLMMVTFTTLINPYFIKGALFPFHLLNVLRSPTYSSMIAEATSAFHQTIWPINAYFIIIVFIFYLFIFLTNSHHHKNKIVSNLFAIGTLLITAYTTFSADRNLPLMALWCLPFAFDSQKKEIDKTKKTFLFIGFFLTLLIRVDSHLEYFDGSKNFRKWSEMPEEAANFIEKNNIKGKAFSTDLTADFLLNRLYGAFTPYIDSRFAELYDESHFLRYMQTTATPELIDESYRNQSIDLAIINHQSRNQIPLIQHLREHSENWKLIHLDPISIIFIHKRHPDFSKWSDLAQLNANVFFSKWDLMNISDLSKLPHHHLIGIANIAGVFEFNDLSYKLFRIAATARPRDPESINGICSSKLISCKQDNEQCLNETLPICKKSLLLSPRSEKSLITTGILYKSLKAYPEAIIYFNRAIKINPLSFEANAMLGESILLQNQTSPESMKAESPLIQASKLRPTHFLPPFLLAQMYDINGFTFQVIENFERSLQLNPPKELLPFIHQRLKELEEVR